MNDNKEIVKAFKELTKELKAIRLIMKQWDDDPPIDEADPDEYIVMNDPLNSEGRSTGI